MNKKFVILVDYHLSKNGMDPARQFSSAVSIIRPAQIRAWKKQQNVLKQKAEENLRANTNTQDVSMKTNNYKSLPAIE